MGLPLAVRDLVWSFPRSAPFLNVPRLDLDAGQVAVLIGPSGAGKTTLLSLLAGLDRGPRGSVFWGGTDLSQARLDHWRRRHLGFVFQDFQLVAGLSALQNVLLPLTFDQARLRPDQRRLARDLLDRLGVDRTDAATRTLSRGEQQRVALARALIRDPQVLLADEPTASLDGDREALVTDLLIGLGRERGLTVVVASHATTVQQRADRRWVLDHGRVLEAS